MGVPLHYALENLYYVSVKTLLDSGMTVDVKTSNSSTPFLIALDSAIDAAIQNHLLQFNFSVVKRLLENEADETVVSEEGISKGR